MSKRIKIGQAGEFVAGKLHPVKIEGQTLLLYIGTDNVCAVGNHCSHWPFVPMNAGHVIDGDNGPVIQCPLHGSQFDMKTGDVVNWITTLGPIKAPGIARKALAIGRGPAPIAAYKVEEENGELFVLLPDEAPAD